MAWQTFSVKGQMRSRFSFRNLAVAAPPRGSHVAGRRQPGRVPGERHARRQAVGVSVPGPG